MSKPSFSTLAALVSTSVLALGAAGRPSVPEVLLKDRDHEKLGELVRDWIASLTDAKRSRADARDKVYEELEKWRKKREVGGRDPLALTQDLGRALWYSNDYARAKGIKKGKVAEVEVEVLGPESRKIEFAMHAPNKYRPADGPYPLILCIPEAGERPSDHLTQHWSLKDIREAAILAVVPMPAETAAWTEDSGSANFFTVFLEMARTYAVDFDRIFLAGRGRGVETAMSFAARFPDRFAGVIGRAGDAGTVRCDNFSNLPSFFAGAGKQATDFAAACKAAEHDNVSIVADANDEQIWAWIQDHPRVSNPTRVVLLPGSPFPNKAYWLEVLPFDNADGKATIRATVDRSANTITVDAKGIRDVRLYFNDLLVDLDSPVKVICNGVEHEDLVPRSLNDLLGTIESGRSDPGKLYTASKRYDIPARE